MRLIDVLHLDRERVIGCWQVGEVLIDPGPASCLPTLLEALGDERPRALLLTHIHLDHAGASGSLVHRWPDLEVYVHERGAPHLTDPSRLLKSARRLYGDDMDRLWGETIAVPERNIRVLRGGERVIDARFEVAYTPGHASHHVSYLHEGTAFVGDVGGVRIVTGALTIPPTPPPDIDLEAWHDSIEQLRRWAPRRLAVTHFGAYEDVDAQLHEMSVRLDDWAERARAQDRDAFIAGVGAEIDAGVSAQIDALAGAEIAVDRPGIDGAEVDVDAASIRSAYTQAAPPEQIYMGLERYWRKRAEAVGAQATPPVS